MKDVELKNLKADVREICYQNVEEILLMFKYCLIAYVKSVKSFGFKHVVSQDVVRLWKEFLEIVQEERGLLKYLIEYGFLEDAEEVNNFILELENANEEMIKYYYEVLDEIETACEMKMEWRAVRVKKNFATLTETDKYRQRLCALTLSLNDIKSFLGYEEDFWKYIQTKILFIDSHLVEDNFFYGVNIKLDDNNCLVDIKVLVPVVINLETALVNIHEFNHAYGLYKILGSPIIDSDIIYEEKAQNREKLFQEEYMPKKYKKILEKQ